MEMAALDGLLRPKAIAIVGASNTPGKIGHTVVKNLIDCQYDVGIYPINPKGGEILGLQVYPSVLNVPHNIDAAILVIPARLTPKIAAECGQKGIKGLIILASGFSEMGRTALEDEVVRTAHQYGMRVLGPNIVGFLSNSDKCNASFAPTWIRITCFAKRCFAHRDGCGNVYPPCRFRQVDLYRQYVGCEFC